MIDAFRARYDVTEALVETAHGAGRVQGAAGAAGDGGVTRVPCRRWFCSASPGSSRSAYGAALIFAGARRAADLRPLPDRTRTAAPWCLERFGAAILGFMGGCLWGFASARPQGPSVALLTRDRGPGVPRLRRDPGEPGALLPLARLRLRGRCRRSTSSSSAPASRPAYWLTLRLPLTAVVIACLLVGALYG